MVYSISYVHTVIYYANVPVLADNVEIVPDDID